MRAAPLGSAYCELNVNGFVLTVHANASVMVDDGNLSLFHTGRESKFKLWPPSFHPSIQPAFPTVYRVKAWDIPLT